MKYAIVESGGKQYKAVPGEVLDVDRLSQEIGEILEFDVLLFSDGEKVEVGSPTVSGVKVKASVKGMIKGPKLFPFKYTPKKRIRRKMGHRQQYTRLSIDEIVGI